MSLPPVEIPLGAMRFNSDSQKLEYFNGDIWMQVHTFSPDLNGGARGLIGGGISAETNIIDYITVTTAGNATDFGDLTRTGETTGFGSNTRAIWAGGYSTGTVPQDTIDYVTIAQTGNATDFGNLATGRFSLAGLSNQTRGIIAFGGTPSQTNVIEYITIASAGNGVDFGDTLTTGANTRGGVASPTRGIFMGLNYAPANTNYNVIQYITIPTTGNATDFGDMNVGRHNAYGISSGIRGLAGGGNNPSQTNQIDYITIATRGNASDFGDLTSAQRSWSGCGHKIRGIFAGGGDPGVNIINYVTLATTGDAIDFGDLTAARESMGGTSNAHGGLG